MDTILYRGWYCNTTYATLTQDERYHNGMKLAQLLYNLNWTEESIAGILGNVEPESGLSPAMVEGNEYPDFIPSNAEVLANTSFYGGLGFVQWTPGRIELVDWAENNRQQVWYDGMTQVNRFKWELENNYGWPYWSWYVGIHSPPDDCAEFFCRHYCRPANPDATVGYRRAAGLRWYDNIHDKLHKPIDWVLYSKKQRERKELKRRCLRM